MKSTVSTAALVLAAYVASVPSAMTQAPPAAGTPKPQIDIAYVEPTVAALRPFYERLKRRQVLEQLQAFLAPVRLPRKLTIKIDQCGKLGVHYTPGAPVTLCYEYIAELERAAPDVKLRIGGQVFTREDALVGAFVHMTLHEVARALFDLLEIPVWGREEHAADRVAGFLMFQFGERVAFRTLVGSSWFLAQSSAQRSGLPSGDFSYTRALDGETMQRFYNTLCIALGGAPGTFFFVKKSLPEGRADNCRWEYLQLKRSFTDAMLPHIDLELMQKVQDTDWLATDDTR